MGVHTKSEPRTPEDPGTRIRWISGFKVSRTTNSLDLLSFEYLRNWFI